MNAHIEPNITNLSVRIWLWNSAPGRIQTYTPEPGGLWRMDEHPEAVRFEDVPPSLELHTEALEAIVRAAGDSYHPGDATADALKDARVVRDRLLSLIEAHAAPDS